MTQGCPFLVFSLMRMSGGRRGQKKILLNSKLTFSKEVKEGSGMGAAPDS